MKKITLLFIAVAAIGCGSQKNNNAAKTNENYTLYSTCPENGKCTVTIAKDSALAIVTDEATNRPYYNVVPAPGRSVITYAYTKKTNPKLADDGYIEKVVFEADNSLSELKKAGTDLQKTKMLFGVFCFCRDRAGFYPVKDGKLTYKNNRLTLTLPDIVDRQLTKTVDIEFTK